MQLNAAHSAHSIHFRLTFIVVTRYTLCLKGTLERFRVLARGRVCSCARGKRSSSKWLLRHKVGGFQVRRPYLPSVSAKPNMESRKTTQHHRLACPKKNEEGEEEDKDGGPGWMDGPPGFDPFKRLS